MADTFDKPLSEPTCKALKSLSVPEGDGISVYNGHTRTCIEGLQFSTRFECLLYRSLPTQPLMLVIDCFAVPECEVFRGVEMASVLTRMSTLRQLA